MTRTIARRLAIGAAGLGLVAFTGVVGWWWLVFGEVIATAGLSVPDALICMVGTSDLCSLAQSLCKSSHFLGIRHYSVEAFWLASLVLAAGAAVSVAPSRQISR